MNELLTLVKDMDNDVEIELMDAETAAKCASGGIRLARGEELSLCDEWTHNPTLAMARPDKLARLASKTTIPSSDANGASASFEAQVDDRRAKGEGERGGDQEGGRVRGRGEDHVPDGRVEAPRRARGGGCQRRRRGARGERRRVGLQAVGLQAVAAA